MLLSLLGFHTSRQAARALFGIDRPPRRYTGTELTELASVLRSTGQLANVRWLFLKRFTFTTIASLARRQLNATGFPTLLWFRAAYRRRSIRAFHVALVVDVRSDRILLLDPLGQAPRKQHFNVSIRPPVNGSRLLEVEGSFYEVDSGRAGGILCWRRPRLGRPSV